MRTENRKAKAMATVPIPDRLRAFLSEVRDLIGRGDEAAILPSDDLLQSDDAYGGLTNDGDYSFVFFPGAGVRTKWEIRLRRDEISAIADGQMVALQLWRCHEESCGSMFASSTDLCFDCDYVDDNPDRLPKGRFGYETRLGARIFLAPTGSPSFPADRRLQLSAAARRKAWSLLAGRGNRDPGPFSARLAIVMPNEPPERTGCVGRLAPERSASAAPGSRHEGVAGTGSAAIGSRS